MVIDTVEFTPEEAAHESTYIWRVKASSDLMKNWPEREGKLLLGTKIENQERMILRLSSEDARICASVAAMH